jgi:excisionase family DNA binding protein
VSDPVAESFSSLHSVDGVAEPSDRLLTPREVAVLFRVDSKTVARWAATGRIKGVRTPGGQWRFRESDVRDALR